MEQMVGGKIPANENVEIETVKKQIKDKCSKLQKKLHKMDQNRGPGKEDIVINQEHIVASTSKLTSKQYVAPINSFSSNDEKQKIKEKINHVKKKFAKINMKINGVLEDSSVKGSRKEEVRSRSNSERSSLISERSGCIELLRSQSVTISTSTLISENIEEDANEEGGESKKARRRRKKRQIKDRKMEDVYNLELDNELRLNAETLLILDLLSLPEDQRESFLISRAKDKKILIENPESHRFEVNPKIAKLQSILCNGNTVWELNDSVRHRVQDIANSKIQKIEAVKKERVRPLFEVLVNAVVCEGLTEEQREQYLFPVTPKRQRTKNYIYTKEFTKNLEDFAQKCVDGNLGVIIEGEIRVNAKNNDQAFIKHVHGEKDAMFCSQLIRKCALHGDIVRAFIRIKANDNKEVPADGNTTTDCIADEDDEDPLEMVPERSAKGFVITILEEVHNRRCVGSFLSYRLDSEYITFVPRDMKMPNIRIYKENWPEEFTKGNMENIQDTLYVALITDWSGDICIGKILQAVGKCGELEAENNAILLQNKLTVTPYDDKFNEMFYGPLMITNEERKIREDLRSECIFTIDPLTARDLDDAMSCKVLPNGNYEIGVHISDVAYFLQEDSELDRIVKQRTTSIYMVNEVFHMLPKPLCLKCSLLPGEDKLAFSVIWEITPAADVIKTRFCRSIINSCTQLAYEHAQKIIDFPDKDFTENDFPTIYNDFTAADIVGKVKVLHSLATMLRKRRFDNGAIKINKPKLYFELDPESGAPVNYGVCQLSTANFLIEEFMLLANQSVAKFTYDKFPEVSILRNHDPPVPNVLKDLRERLASFGLDLNISSSKSLYESLLTLVRNNEDKDLMEICLSHIISKPMTRAKYFCSASKESEAEFWHYALSIPMYTHFTSPIRRYPDVLVHRVLSAALGYTPPPKRTPKELQKIATLCNEHKSNAKNAGDDSLNLYFLHYIKSKQYLTVRAAVLEMWLHAMEVILIETGHVVRVPYPKEGKKNAKIILNNKTRPYTAQLIFTNVPNSEPKELKMFSEIFVEIYVEKNKLKGRIAIPSTPSSDEVSKDCTEAGKEDLSYENTNQTKEDVQETTESCELQTSVSAKTVLMPDKTNMPETNQNDAPKKNSASLVPSDKPDKKNKSSEDDPHDSLGDPEPGKKISEEIIASSSFRNESIDPTTNNKTKTLSCDPKSVSIQNPDIDRKEGTNSLGNESVMESQKGQEKLKLVFEKEEFKFNFSLDLDTNSSQTAEPEIKLTEKENTEDSHLEELQEKESAKHNEPALKSLEGNDTLNLTEPGFESFTETPDSTIVVNINDSNENLNWATPSASPTT